MNKEISMANSSETFRKKLKQLIDSGTIKKIDLHRKTGIARNSIDGYLMGATPDLDVLDKIANVLGLSPLELISNPDQTPILPHTIQDCLEAVNKVALGKTLSKPPIPTPEEEPPLAPGEIRVKVIDNSLDEGLVILSSLDESQRRDALRLLKSFSRASGTTTIVREKKAK
jgi:transcriptional regulator with XRE-family HTH domain